METLSSEGVLPDGLDLDRLTVEPPRDASHGDVSTNAAMVLAKQAKRNPRDIAGVIAERMSNQASVEGAELAGPGFVNLRLSPAIWTDQLRAVLRQGEAFGDTDLLHGQRINVEYVSANPTGPLHAAHARGAVVGDALAKLLAKAGADVTREYYINDAGKQVEILGRSTYLRYREACGDKIDEIPSGMYPGAYLKEVGAAIASRDGDKWLRASEDDWLPVMRDFAIETLMAEIKRDLVALGVDQAVFSSERALVEEGAVERAFEALSKAGHIYEGVLEPPKGKKPDDWEPRPQTLFRATAFGDDVDRPLKKSDGSWTYFAADIAYHYDKFRRGCDQQIDVWGADHGGYVKRMQAAIKAITDNAVTFDVILCQIVHMFDNGQPVRMSKRAGTFVTLADLLDVLGPDVVRFAMLTRRHDQQLDFDYAKVQEQSRDNPVFYVHYAHARCHSVLRMAAERFEAADITADSLAEIDLSPLVGDAEIAVLKHLAAWPRLVEQAAVAREPHRVAFYLYDLAAAFHSLWTAGKDDATLRFLVDDNPDLSRARLALVLGVAAVIRSGLAVMGVRPVEEM
ncbi:MAG: arginine--tRNA ligase [Pseudomonadota bacterium]